MRKNRNRGYQELVVWQDAIGYYSETCRNFRKFPYDLKRIASQAIACSDSVHRNIAEGYCRRSLKEYLNFLNIALGSIGESVSGLVAYSKAGQLDAAVFDHLDSLAYKIENGLLRLVESLEKKRDTASWSDQSVIRETNAIYQADPDPTAPSPHYPTTPQEDLP